MRNMYPNRHVHKYTYDEVIEKVGDTYEDFNTNELAKNIQAKLTFKGYFVYETYGNVYVVNPMSNITLLTVLNEIQNIIISSLKSEIEHTNE